MRFVSSALREGCNCKETKEEFSQRIKSLKDKSRPRLVGGGVGVSSGGRLHCGEVVIINSIPLSLQALNRLKSDE